MRLYTYRRIHHGWMINMNAKDSVVFLSDYCMSVFSGELVTSLDFLPSPVTPVQTVFKYCNCVRMLDCFWQNNLTCQQRIIRFPRNIETHYHQPYKTRIVKHQLCWGQNQHCPDMQSWDQNSYLDLWQPKASPKLPNPNWQTCKTIRGTKFPYKLYIPLEINQLKVFMQLSNYWRGKYSQEWDSTLGEFKL